MRSLRICFSFLLFPFVFLAVGILLILTGYSDYYQDYKASSEVTAVVTKCQYDTWYDSDDLPQSGYDIYIDYTYNNETYTNIYWKTKNNPITLGETVSVRISPNNPEKPFSSHPFSLIFVGIPFAVAGIVIAFKMVPASFSWHEHSETEPAKSAKSKKHYLFALIPAGVAILFLILGFNIAALFHIGTIIFAYFTVVVLEML